MEFMDLFENKALIAAILAWFAAQLIKVLLVLFDEKKLDLSKMISSGGMPSSHSALITAMTASVGKTTGLDSVAFAIAAVTSLVVMYDACNVRRAAGEQAKILNYIVEHWEEMSPALVGKELKELLGHTPAQVFMGAVLGVCVGWFGVAWLG